jgi:hypothetical protein
VLSQEISRKVKITFCKACERTNYLLEWNKP